MRKSASLAFAVSTALLGMVRAAAAEIPIPARPPAFGFLNIDERERWFERTLAAARHDGALGPRRLRLADRQLKHIKAEQGALRMRHGGQLTMADRRSLDHQMDVLADRIGLARPSPGR